MKKKICYLCGKTIAGKSSKDHIPPKQFFPINYKKDHDISNLITLATHEDCNYEFQKDEEYFVVALTPGITDIYLSIGAFDRLRKMSRRKQSRPLLHQVVGEFSKKIGNIHQPPDVASKTYDRSRTDRV